MTSRRFPSLEWWLVGIILKWNDDEPLCGQKNPLLEPTTFSMQSGYKPLLLLVLVKYPYTIWLFNIAMENHNFK